MSFDDKIAEIYQKYLIVDTIRLSDYFKNNDQWLYERLLATYRPVYANQERILVIQDCNDVYAYDDYPGKSIITLQKYASQLDISNFFILIVTANSGIAVELTQAKELYSTDACSMQYQIIDYPIISSIEEKLQDTFCVLPWMHLYVGPDGNVLPCCQADHDFPIGNIEKSSIPDIINSQKYNQLRSNMLSGRRCKECSRCYEREDLGLQSTRILSNQEWQEFTPTTVEPDGAISNFAPVSLDIRLNNICNLKCRMCSSYFSSAIAQENNELFGKDTKTFTLLNSKQRVNALEEILNYVPHVKRIYFAGGEPLLAPEHYKILDALIESDNTNVKLCYNTNFTNLNFKNQSVIDWWKKFKNVSIGASLDAIGSVAEYVRHGSVWADIEKNLNLLQEQCPEVVFTVTSTVGFLNAISLIELQQIWHTTGRLDIKKFSLTTMTSPDHLTLATLPEQHKIRIDAAIQNHIIWCQEKSANGLAKQWQDVLTYMWSRDNGHHLAEFKRLTQIMDQHRKESFKEIFPEFQDLL